MSAQSQTIIDLNAATDFERAVGVLKNRAGALYREYQKAKHDPAQSDENRTRLLQAYGEALEETKTLRPNDAATIQDILQRAA
jgi:hypothetical protein